MSGGWSQPLPATPQGGADLLACPHCGWSLAEEGDNRVCRGCGQQFRSLRGIPDLRTKDDEYLPNRADWAFALRLDEAFDRFDFRGLLERYFELAIEVPAGLRKRQINHILSAPDRAQQWLDSLGPASAGGPILDLGCGSGSFLATMAAGGRELWGVDIALRWLLVARKRLDEEGLAHIHLVCGCAEQLPFRERVFTGVVAGDVIEHVGNQQAALAESFRVLRPGGRLVLASPNRFSLAPEPHVGVWGVGYLPRRWMNAYVRMARGLDFRAIRTLSYGEWKRLIRHSPFRTGTIAAPGLTEGDFIHFGMLKRALAQIYNRLVETRVGQWLARQFGPLFHVCCTRPAEAAHANARATRQRSTQSRAQG